MAFERRRFACSWLDMLCIATVGVIVAAWLASDQFSPDSWSYFELSQTFFSDFYRINTYRQYQTVSPYATSFPPLFPFLLAVGRAVWDLGIYTGVLLNAIICVATLFAAKELIKHIGLPTWIGNILFLMMLTRPTYVNEVMAGRSMPLALFLLVVTLRVYVSPSTMTLRRAALIGLLAGLSILTRFDFLASAIVLGLVLGWYARKQSWFVTPVYLAALAVTVSPWVFYSLSHFSKLFVSDNSRTATLVSKSHVTDYFPAEEQLEFVWDAPLSWAFDVFVRRFPWTLQSCKQALFTDPTLAILAGILVGVWLVGHSSSQPFSINRRSEVNGAGMGEWGGLALALAVQVLTVGFTGYTDLRYYLSLQFLLALVLAHAVNRRVDLQLSVDQWPEQYLRSLSALCAATTVMLAVSTGALSDWKSKLLAVTSQQFDVLDQGNLSPSAYAELLEEIHSSEKEPRILIVSGVNAFKFGALTGCTTFSKPRNLTAETLIPFVHAYRVTHVLDTDDELLSALRGTVSVELTETPGLVRILTDELTSSLSWPPNTDALKVGRSVRGRRGI